MPEDTGITAAESLGSDVNKTKRETTQDTNVGVVSDKLPELTLEMADADIIKLTDKWEKSWLDSPSKADWEKQIEENEKYWLGKQFDLPNATLEKRRPNVDNLIFESVETYLPQVTRRNPEPLVTLDATEEEDLPVNQEYIAKVKKRLADLADKNKIRLKLKKGGRHWAIYQLGVAKFGWDLDKDIPIVRIIRPKKLILDPESTIDEDGYTGNRIGEHRKIEASILQSIIKDDPTATDGLKKIEELTKGDLGTDIQFIEWWTPQFMVWRLGSTILLKKKNPHWNYDKTNSVEKVDDYGATTQQQEEVKGINHFPSPLMPYTFLSVFNLGDQPMDKTSLIGQNLSNQDLLNKRNRQIDKNADKMNGGAVVSLGRSGLSQTQAKGVVDAIRKGGAVLIPDGAPQEAVYFPTIPALPADVYNQLLDTRSRMRDIFGVKGSSQAGLETEKTVRGKIMGRTFDSDRIGGGVSEYLEQFADDIYNWFVQLLYVYDSGFQFIAGAVPPKILISVKEGSLLPKDSMTIANQAIELGTAGKMALVDMYKRLEYPNAEELAANVWLEVNAPHLLYKNNPLIQEAIMMQQQNAQAQADAEAKKAEADKQNKTDQSTQDHSQKMEIEALKATAKGEQANKRLSIPALSSVPTK